MRSEALTDPFSRVTGLAGRETTLVGALAFWLALVQISIAASQIVLTFVIAVAAYQWASGRQERVRLPIDWPAGLFALTSLAAAAFSFDPPTSFTASKKLVLLLVPYLVVSAVRRVDVLEKLTLLLIVMADLAALVGLWQYFFGDLGDLNHRIRGFMSHYMTFSGQLMAVGALSFGLLLFQKSRRGFLLGSFLLIETALVLTLTRSAWLGMLAAIGLLCFLRNRKLLVLIPLIVVVVLAVVPSQVSRRVRSFVELDRSGRDRLYMLESGWRMTRNHPWLGLGPDMVRWAYPVYVPDGAPHHENVHLHNNLAQIAAERGLPSAAAWIWLMAAALAAGVRSYRRTPGPGPERGLAAGALGVLVAGVTAGCFEYNFGDSEFQMIFLFGMGIAFVLEKNRREGAPP